MPIAVNHIALFMPELECGGAQRVFLLLSKEFVRRGLVVDLVVIQGVGPLLDEIPPGVNLVDLRSGWKGFGRLGLGLSAIVGLSVYLRRVRPDGVISTVFGANVVASVARYLSGVECSLVIRESSRLVNHGGVVWGRVMKWVYRNSDHVVVLSAAIKDQLLKMFYLDCHRVAVIANPLDIESIKAKANLTPCGDISLPCDRPYILSVGRLVVEKDYGTLIRAFAQMQGHKKKTLIILGEGPERQRLEGLIMDLGLSKNVLLPGHDPNPWRWMKGASLFVLSSTVEGMPNALMEAIGMGLPVVSTEYDASAVELVGDYGMTVPAGEVGQLAAAMDLSFGSQRSDYKNDRWGLEATADQYLDLLGDRLD